MFSLLPRMRYGLFYNTPLVSCFSCIHFCRVNVPWVFAQVCVCLSVLTMQFTYIFANVSFSYFHTASSASSSVCLYPTFCDRIDFSHLSCAPSLSTVDIQFSHKHAAEVKYLCDVFKSTVIAFFYLNVNSKEIPIKMIPYKYVLSRGSSP